eukprot:TRINITY_DN63219_c0_g1_i1.p1 TRINITY_DN63219_c0_g1~~TRINITY_DN63219_c0_g1_i1.p1  ORF type:complete len:632 (-),score=131.19 TRINITY_DN63219_c0_g1_i1:97-1992(-)
MMRGISSSMHLNTFFLILCLASFGNAVDDQNLCEADGVCEASLPGQGKALLQAHVKQAMADVIVKSQEQDEGEEAPAAGEETCSVLKNKVAYSAVEVKVGTPPQKFDVVADTGSNNVILQSCVCQDTGSCQEAKGECFRGTGKSSTFYVQGKTEKHPMGPPEVMIKFGSGTVGAVVASDAVGVGNLKPVMMKNSLLLMVTQALHMRHTIEGILGLGLPPAKNGPKLYSKLSHQPKGFLQAAGVSRFSMCFNRGADGVMDLNTKKQKDPIATNGDWHWSLGFHGISVGSKDNKPPMCHRSTMNKMLGERTPCSLIVDSGTTLMTGPRSGIASLFNELCARWPRCVKAKAAAKKKLEKMLKAIKKIKNAVSDASQKRAQVNSAETRLSESESESEDVDSEIEDFVDRFTNSYVSQTSEDEFFSSIQRAHERPDELNEESANETRPRSMAASLPPSVASFQGFVVFQALLQDCHSWMGKGNDVNKEVPPLYFNVGGNDGKRRVLEMKGNSYISTTTRQVYEVSKKKLLGFIPKLVKKEVKVCIPAFNVLNYHTKKAGDVWIFGGPAFYDWQVHYDGSAKPPTIAFSNSPCGKCVDGKHVEKSEVGLLESSASDQGMRHLDVEPRIPDLDTSLPL